VTQTGIHFYDHKEPLTVAAVVSRRYLRRKLCVVDETATHREQNQGATQELAYLRPPTASDRPQESVQLSVTQGHPNTLTTMLADAR
jgi:hypothetical protein